MTDDTFSTVGNVYDTNRNMRLITPRGFVKQTAKDTGKAVVFDNGKNLSVDSKSGQPGSNSSDEDNTSVSSSTGKPDSKNGSRKGKKKDHSKDRQ